MRLQKVIGLFAATVILVSPGVSIGDEPLKSQESETSPSKGKFQARLALTHDENELRRTWNDSAASPQLRVTETAKLGQEVTTVILFDGCASNERGACDVVAEFFLVAPDGSRHSGGRGSVWSTKPLEGKLMLGAASMTIGFKDRDPIGAYQVEARITDTVRSTTIVLTTPLRVVER